MGCGCSGQVAGVSSPSPTQLTANQSGSKACGTCPSGHTLQLQERPSCDRCRCDICGEEIPKGEYLWGCRACDYDKCSECARKWQAGGAKCAAALCLSSDTPQQAPTLLSGGLHLATGKFKNLLRTVLEKHNVMFDGSKEHVGEFVNNVYVHAFGIIQEGSGLGASGECPFASAYEVHLFYQFCLHVCAAWSGHQMGRDEQMDEDFYSQMGDLCEILCFLDTDVIPLPEEIAQKIEMLQRDALFPHWVDAQIPKGEAALECCVSVGKKWKLEETQAFQKALAALEKCNRDVLWRNAMEKCNGEVQ